MAKKRSITFMATLFLVIIISVVVLNSCNKQLIGIRGANWVLQHLITDSTNIDTNTVQSTIIENERAAKRIAGKIVRKKYGLWCSIDEKPYEAYLIGEIWVIMGTLRKGWIGGTFAVVLNRNNGKLINVAHFK